MTHAWRAAALAGALLGAACSKEPAPAPAPKPAARPSTPAQAPEPEPEPEAEEDTPTEAAPAPAGGASAEAPKDFEVGQPRDAVMRLLGDCAERRSFIPGGDGHPYVEVYQPKPGECRKRLGERRLTIKGGTLVGITPGVLPPPPPPRPPPEGV